MILPVTHLSVLLLLAASLVCLGLWINTFKASGPRWRFELFSIDFAVGALLLVVIAAYTLGTLGSDLAFSDRILVAGRTAQALALIAGAVFNLGNMLLLAAVSLLGISTAFPLSAGMALIVNSCFRFRPGNLLFLILGIIIMVVAIGFEIRSSRLREAAASALAKRDAPPAPAVPPPHGSPTQTPQALSPRPAPAATASAQPPTATVQHVPHHSKKVARRPKLRKPRRSVRGVVAGILGGVALGLFIPILNSCVPGDLGLGPYAGMLLFGIGVLVSTIVYNFYFLNITIEGAPLTFGAYFEGGPKQHLLGFAGGALCLCGLLTAALAFSAPGTAGVPLIVQVLVPLLSVPLAFIFGIAIWREFAVSAKAKRTVIAGICVFIAGLALLAVGVTR